jgi:hypothetical protein
VRGSKWSLSNPLVQLGEPVRRRREVRVSRKLTRSSIRLGAETNTEGYMTKCGRRRIYHWPRCHNKFHSFCPHCLLNCSSSTASHDPATFLPFTGNGTFQTESRHDRHSPQEPRTVESCFVERSVRVGRDLRRYKRVNMAFVSIQAAIKLGSNQKSGLGVKLGRN